MSTQQSIKPIKVSVTYATPLEQIWHQIEVPESATLLTAITVSGILNECPEIDLKHNKVGVFGRLCDLHTNLNPGDRVEIYRPIKIDPEKLERKKYKLRKIEPIIEKLKT